MMTAQSTVDFGFDDVPFGSDPVSGFIGFSYELDTMFLAMDADYPLAATSSQGRLPGEFIVRFEGDLDIQKWGEEWGLDHVRTLSKRAQIHLFDLPSSSSPADDWAMLRTLRKDDRLVAAQFNHEVQSRETVPNDPALNQQWQHVQDGDHDIDSDLAWDITTGGQTADGTRIVVAVLEGGGANYNHIDLIDNHWVNDQEIPDNGIDDDNNGFVDDYNLSLIHI